MLSNKRACFDVRDVFTRERPAMASVGAYDDHAGNLFFVKLSSSAVLIGLTHPSVLHFYGILSVKCVYGKIESLGHRISRANGNMNAYYTIFSLLDRSAMYLATFDGSEDESNDIDALKEFDLTSEKIELIRNKVGRQGAILVASSRLDSYRHWDAVLQSANMSVFPRNDKIGSFHLRDFQEVLDCMICSTDDLSFGRLMPHSSWNEICDLLLKSRGNHKILVYGGKGVGKSTAIKFLVNRYLSRFKEVLFVDLDVGQSEFTICGSVSAVRVTKPLLGSNFTHLEVPQKSLHLGVINVSQCLGSYLEYVQKIIEFCQQGPISNVPWFVNTMGMHKGIGAQLLAKIIEIVRPVHVIEVKSSKSDRNFPFSLSCIRVNELFPSSSLKYSSHTIASNTPLATKSPLNPASLRNAVAYVYFSKLLSMRSLRSVKFCRVSETQRSRLALGDVVALCWGADCAGYGLVVKLASDDSVVGIVSPLSNRSLRAVNSILRTDVNLKPHSILQGFKELQGPVNPVLEPGQRTAIELDLEVQTWLRGRRRLKRSKLQEMLQKRRRHVR